MARSGALTARGPPPRNTTHGAYGPLSARGTASDRGTAGATTSISSSRRKPSEILAAARQPAGAQQLKQEATTPRILAFQNLSNFTHHVDTVVAADEPLFRATPAEIRFSGFESLQSFDATLCLRNQDTVARRVKIMPPDSSFFQVLPGKGRRSMSNNDNKVAPGMEVQYIVRFTPDAQVEDYSYDLIVVTEREKFVVPIRATGGHALLDLPDFVDFGSAPVKYETLKTVLVRNVGEKPSKFLLRTPHPFSTSVQDGYLEVGETMQVDIVFRPDKEEEYEREMLVIYGDGVEASVSLRGSAEKVNVTFSVSQLNMIDTFIALSTQKTIIIHNHSEVPVDFSWRAFPTIEEEIGQKLKLQVQLKQEEGEEVSALQQLGGLDEDSSDEDLSDTSDDEAAARTSFKTLEMARGALSRRYQNIAKAILEDPMFFYDEIFSVEPLSGRIWAKSKAAVTFTFTPKAALNYQCLAYCSVVGQADRLPLLLKGQGIGPKAAFSYDELDVGDIFVESVHQYEVNLINQGDIDVNFRLVPNHSPFGSKFTFTPREGLLEVGGQCTIVVEVCPDLLGEFQETFYWELVGSTSSIPLNFKGHSVSPTFHFDLDRISFGVISYGFLNSKTLTLTNTSEVPMRFALRIPGDGRFAQREFDVIPPKGTLLPNCSQKVQVDFISVNVKSYDLCLVVDLDGVGQELASIPIQARCAVPHVTFEPQEILEYGNIFIRYPSHQTLILNNTSALPAKFQILPQEESTRALADFEPDQSVGSVPPASSHVITFTLTSQKIGPLQIPIVVRILGHSQPRTITLVANSIGPIVNVEPSTVDWGNAKCLEPITREVKITNNSVINAHVRCVMKTKNSLWTVSPKALELKPHESSTLSLTLTIDEVTKMTDILHVVVHESNDVAVTVKAKGIATPVMCRESLEVIDFGTQYTTQTITREVLIENRGRQARKLQWILEADDPAKKKDKNREERDPNAVQVFSVTPDTIQLDGKCAYRFVFNAMSPKAGELRECLLCQETIGNDRKGNTIFRTDLMGTFVNPLLSMSSNLVSFRYLWDRDTPIHPLCNPLTLTNISPLEIRFFIKVQPPFYVNIDSYFLRPEEHVEIRVEFDPAFKVDRVCGVVKQKLTIMYQDHPQKDSINLVGEVVFPNLELNSHRLDFGSVLNETTKQMTVTLSNPNPLPVNFQWSFVEEQEVSDADYAMLTDRSHSPMSIPGPGSAMNSANNTATSGFYKPQQTSGDPSVASEAPSQPSLSRMNTNTIDDAEVTVERASLHQTLQPPGSRKAPIVDINQIFDILPIMGTLESGESQTITFTYFGMQNQKFDATAVCQTEGGPEYEVTLKGQASKLDFRVDKTELDFEEVPYNEVQERDIFLSNMGKVAYYFNLNLSALSRPTVLDCSPVSGQINPGDREKITIRFRAGIPDEVSEVALLEVAHFERQRIQVRGHGIFPGILLSVQGPDGVFRRLERSDEQSHEEKKALAVERLLKSGPPPAGACSLGSVHGNGSIGGSAVADDSSSATASASALGWQPDSQLVEFEVDRYSMCESLLETEKELLRRKAEQKENGQVEAKAKAAAKGASGNRATARGSKAAPMLELPPITAACYVCNFGHIVLGHSGKKVISVQNCFSEPVSFSINRKALMSHGFQVNPERVKKLPVGRSVKLELTSFRERDDPEGTQELNWIIPIRGGPSYEVKLMSEFVRPDLELSSESVDFGHVLVGQVKRMTIKLRNVKPVLVSWDYKAPRDKMGKLLPPQEIAYSLSPSSGKIAPGEIQFVTISFAPNAAKGFHQKLALRIIDNPARKLLSLHGSGDALKVSIEPSTDFQLGPVLPGAQDCVQEFFLVNPTDYPIEVYSVDFDSKYIDEEFCLQVYESYNVHNQAELAVRAPGAPTWKALAEHGAKVRREQERKARRLAKEQAARERQQRLQQAQARVDASNKALQAAPAEDAEAAEKAQAEVAAAQAELEEAQAAQAEADAAEAEGAEEEEQEVEEEEAEESGEVEESPKQEMDPADFPYRVPDEERLHVLIVGPPASGKSTLARQLAEKGRRKVLTLDDAMSWALSGPVSLQGDEEQARRDRIRALIDQSTEEHEKEEAEREKKATKAKEVFKPHPLRHDIPIDDIVHYLKARMQLPDCNACVIIDGLRTTYTKSDQEAVQAVMEAFREEQLVVLGLSMNGFYGLGSASLPLGEGKLPAAFATPGGEAAGAEGAEALAEQVGLQATALHGYYGSLQSALETRVADLQSKLPEAEAAAEKAASAASELAAKVEEKVAAKAAEKEAKEAAADETADGLAESGEAEAEAEDPEFQELQQSLTDAQEEARASAAKVETLKSMLEAYNKANEQIATSASSDEVAKDLAEGMCSLISVLDAAAAKIYSQELEAQGLSALEDGGGAAEGDSPAGEAGTAPGEISEKTMKFAPPIRNDGEERKPAFTFAALGLESTFKAGGTPDADFPRLSLAAQSAVPAPLIPTEPPIPPPSFAQIVEKPPRRAPRPAVENFQILSPGAEDAEAPAASPELESSRPNSKEGKKTPTDAAPEEPKESEPQPTRWLIEPRGRRRLLVKFFSEEIGSFSSNLAFEVVGGINGNAPVSVSASGITAFPGISSDPRNVFMRRAKNKPASGYANRQFISSLGVFDFGPLLAGRDPELRKPPEPEEGEPPQQVDQYIRQHMEYLRITNNSLFSAEVTFQLASAATAAGGAAAEESKKGAKKGDPPPPSPFEEYPFIIEPASLQLEIGETKELCLSCFPVKEGTYSDTIVASIKDNPDPVQFPICAIGALPKVNLDATEVDFDRLLLNHRAVNTLKLANVCAVPVKWRLEPTDKEAGVPDVFVIEPMEGVLSVAEERPISVAFKSDTACAHAFSMDLQIADTEGLTELSSAQDVKIRAEAFSVDVVPEFEGEADGLDFGNVRVGSTNEKTFSVTNNGKYPVNFEIKVRRKAMREILTIDYGVQIEQDSLPELQPGAKQTIKVTAVPTVAMQCPPPKRFARTGRNEELQLLVYEAKTGEQVQLDTPSISLKLSAVYNAFTITPPRGLNFGPVKIGESGSRDFEIYNDGPFKFDWFIFDSSLLRPGSGGGMQKPDTADLSVQNFKITPAHGSLEPQQSVKISGTFTAPEAMLSDCKIGIHVDGLPEEQQPMGGTKLNTDEAGTTGFFGGGGGEGDMGDANKGYREYMLTAQSCTPGIDTENMQAIFEEQFVAPTLEDAIATAGRIDIRAFDEAEGYFSFGPVAVQGPSSSDSGQDAAKFRITNPNPIACDVKFDLKPKPGATGKEAFELSTQELRIPAHEYRYVKVRFAPTGLHRYSAIFEAVVPEGKNPKTNLLTFELRGDGTVPSISLEGPPVFHDKGGQYDFGKLSLGKSHSVEFTLRNQGDIPATARCELAPNANFSLTCPRNLPLEPKGAQSFQVFFRPSEEGDLSTTLRLSTLHNSFEDSRITFAGHGFVNKVSWEIPPLPNVEKASAAATPDDADLLNLGDVALGGEAVRSFQVKNSSKTPIRFEFPETLPAPLTGCVAIVPSVGHVLPGNKKTISFTFKPTEHLKADASLPVSVSSIAYEAEPEVEEWDDSMRAVNFPDEDKEAGIELTAEVLPEPAHRVVEGSAKEMPLRVQGSADKLAYECSVQSIRFSPTVLFQTRSFRFVVKNPSGISLPYNWRFRPASGKAETAGKGLQAYSISPLQGTVAAGGSQEFQIRFAPMEVEDFAGLLDSQMPVRHEEGQQALQLPINASALRPWCHFELPPSDYHTRRQSDTPLDPKYQVIEFESLGTRVKNTKRFYVLNPTSESYDFIWRQEEADKRADTEDPFRCVTKRGTILPGKKYEMVFEYLPMDTDTSESPWTFSLLNKEASQSFILVGTVKEPRIGMDRPCVKFNRLLLGGKAHEKVHIVNKEHLPFSFSFDRKSYEVDGQAPAIALSPASGVVGPGASFPIDITFIPKEEKSFNYNLLCNIKRKDKPILLNVKGEGYKIHTKLVLEEAEREGRILHPGVKETLDFGDMQVQEKRTYTLKLSSPSFDGKAGGAEAGSDEQPTVSYDFIWQLRTSGGRLIAPRPDGPPYLTISPLHGVATQEKETVITVEYSPIEVHSLDGASLQMLIPSGPDDVSYTLGLTGRSYRPALDFSVTSHDFGPCFVKRSLASAGEPTSPAQGNTPFEKLNLTVTNRGSIDCWLSTTFQRMPYLDVQLPTAMVEAGQSLIVPIIFTPRDYVEYRERIEFVVNDVTKTYVNIKGRGCQLLLEPASLSMQNVDFGTTVGNEAVNRSLRLVNRSQRAVEFSLHDPEGHLAEKCVSWSPELPLTLRPKEQTSFELRFAPSFPMPSFKLPLSARCNFGQDVHLCSVTGGCHTAEVRLSEHSITFGDVVFEGLSVRKAHLHNFGDLGVKFRFAIPPKVSQSFSVEPADGFVAPRDNVLLQIKFHPKRQGAQNNRPARLQCILEPSYQDHPVELIVQGRGVEQPEGSAKELQFSTEVRERKTIEITFPPDGKNTSPDPLKLNPVVSTSVPVGVDYFSCPPIVVPPGQQVAVPVTYRPLTMTRQGDAEDDAADGSKKKPLPEKHIGKLFISTPDGNAFVWTLEGTSLQPGDAKKLSAEVQCKTPHIQNVPVSNWLAQNQRFKVDLSLVEPAGAGEEIKLNGVGTFDVPASQAKDYKFNVYAYREGNALVRVVFTDPKTDEFVAYEVSFKFVAPKSIDTLSFTAACRQTVTKSISVMNPLTSVANFKCEASHPDVRFSPQEFVIPPSSEATVDVLYRPTATGSGEGKLSLISPELGDFPYTLQYIAKPAGLEKTIVFKAPLGSVDCVQTFKFLHYAQKPATYAASIEVAPGHQTLTQDFTVEAKEVKADAATRDGVEVSVNVRFQPSELGEIRALLVLTSPDSGEYKALLVGYTQPPQPQGPFDVAKAGGKPTNVDFQNPFTEATEFTVQIDNPNFQSTQRAFKLDPKKALPIPVTFTGDKQQGARLMVSAAKVSTPWVFFLQGVP